MFPSIIEFALAQERHEDDPTEAIRSRRAVTRTSSIRRTVGARFIVLGRRIAAEPVLVLARSR